MAAVPVSLGFALEEAMASELVLHIDFGRALRHLRAGNKVRRKEWPSGVHLKYVVNKENPSAIGVIEICRDEQKETWLPAQPALLAFDWIVMEGK